MNLVADPFPKFQKIARWNRDIIITEKIDGTNGLIHVSEDGTVRAGSRNRWLSVDSDNHGFARWVTENSEQLAEVLGPGHHYGEWWGSGINRGYGLKIGEKRFSLFNVTKHRNKKFPLGLHGLGVVPILYEGINCSHCIKEARMMVRGGSIAAEGYENAEGIVIYHTASNSLYKITLENDEAPKSLVQKAA
jgi:RNA ligase